MLRAFLTLALVAGLAVTTPSPADEDADFDTRLAAMEPLEGFMNLYWDAEAGALWLRVDRFD